MLHSQIFMFPLLETEAWRSEHVTLLCVQLPRQVASLKHCRAPEAAMKSESWATALQEPGVMGGGDAAADGVNKAGGAMAGPTLHCDAELEASSTGVVTAVAGPPALLVALVT